MPLKQTRQRGQLLVISQKAKWENVTNPILLLGSQWSCRIVKTLAADTETQQTKKTLDDTPVTLTSFSRENSANTSSRNIAICKNLHQWIAKHFCTVQETTHNSRGAQTPFSSYVVSTMQDVSAAFQMILKHNLSIEWKTVENSPCCQGGRD